MKEIKDKSLALFKLWYKGHITFHDLLLKTFYDHNSWIFNSISSTNILFPLPGEFEKSELLN